MKAFGMWKPLWHQFEQSWAIVVAVWCCCVMINKCGTTDNEKKIR